MTETAKQDTTKAPAQTTGTGPAATESAATQGKPAPEATGSDQAGPETTGPETPPGPGETTEAKAGESATPDLDETKRKFREALERKHQAHNDGQGNSGRDGSKINGAQGPAASRRNFRRKSG
jgi:Family of unknown function (DUF5302)